MRLSKARVQKYRSIRDSGPFEVEVAKTILVGPNEAGKTALLWALQRLRPPTGVEEFVPLRDYPRSELNDLDSGAIKASDITVVQGTFTLDEDDKSAIEAIDPSFSTCTSYSRAKRLDNTTYHWLEGGPAIPRWRDLIADCRRLASYVDKKAAPEAIASSAKKSAAETLEGLADSWQPTTLVHGPVADQLTKWFTAIELEIDEANTKEIDRLERLRGQANVGTLRDAAQKVLEKRAPTLVYYNNYFRVRPRIHLEHLADRVEQKLLDDDLYDFGNLCLLKLLGFTARELSNLGKAAQPSPGNADALRKYQDQLDARSYRLNAASVKLTEQVRAAWQPDEKKDEASTLRIVADQQYLKVVVQDEQGVDVELDQRSEGFQWLVSFFVVFFAQISGEHKNAILLLDEPGLHLHGLKQREFRQTISNLAEKNQLIFTTHSPFLVGPDELDFVRVVEMKNRKEGTKVHTTVSSGDPAALLPLQEALGYDMAQSLFAQQRNLILEGLTDYWYLEATARLLEEANIASIRPDIALVPAASAGKVVYFATILHAHRLKVAALLDSDAAGEQAARQETLVHALGNKRIIRTRDVYAGSVNAPEIEDLLRETLLKIAAEEHGSSALPSDQPTRPTVDFLAASYGKDFSKYKQAKAYVRWTRDHSAEQLTATERDSFVSLIALINDALK